MKPSIDYGREDIARFLYLEPVLAGKKVLVIGRENDVVRQVFERMGCAAVKQHHPGAEPRAEWDLGSLRGKRERLEEEKRLLPFPSAAFDIVFIPDLAAVEDYRATLAESARCVAPGGFAIVCARNAECTVAVSQTGMDETPEIWSLQSLGDLTRSYFAAVEKVGQCPFLAYAFVSYDEERVGEGVRLDTSLMERTSEEPEFFLFLCSHAPLPARISNAIFEVPVAEMALVESPPGGAGDDEGGGEGAARLRAENELLRKEVADRNVLAQRLKKEIERMEGEAEGARQKMFDLRQKMEQERKGGQKEVLEKAIQKQVDKIPETWLGERSELVRELEQLKKEKLAHRGELRKLQEKLDAMRQGSAAAEQKGERERREAGAAAPLKAEVEKLRGELDRRERLVRELLHELEIMPQAACADELPCGEDEALAAVGKLEESRRALEECGREKALLLARAQELEMASQESRLLQGRLDEENRTLKERVRELLAATDMLTELTISGGGGEGAGEAAAAAGGATAERARGMAAVVDFCLDELQRLSQDESAGEMARELALLWARVEEKRRLVVELHGEP